MIQVSFLRPLMAKVIIISGPTATGKTRSSILLAKKIDAEIVNFDSLLFYKELSIGTAKPTLEEQGGVIHHLINVVSVKTPLNASDFILKAERKIEEILSQNKNVILVGGSAFYLRALIKGMYDDNPISNELRSEVEDLFEDKGIDPFIDFLKKHDPNSLENLHPNDHYRLLRAYEYFKSTGLPISKQKKKLDQNDPYDFSRNNHPHWDIIHIHLDLPKNQHFELIQKRTKKMVEEGLIKEVENLLQKGFSGEEKPLKSIGYKETIAYIKGEFKGLQEYRERISISTRQLAKSQRTFFKKIHPKLEFNSFEFIDYLNQNNLSFLKI